ncbi:SPFH domain-containing protein [Aurantimonas sp. VKM B-3413]|uniref:SPFH domain-containing protein n=1 Tax=Aurantimonas sp. VKM B-3413 TaxID=2779401 RepID=UPI00351D3A90
MNGRIYAFLIAGAAGLLLLWNAIFIVNEKEQALILRFGEIRRVVSEPGLYFKLPFSFAGADSVQKLPDRLLRFDLDNIRVQVSGGKFYEVDAFMVYNISDAARFRQTVSGSIPQAEQRLRTRLDAALRRVYGLRGFEAALSNERGEMMRQVRDEIRPDAAQLGLDIDDVRIRRTDLTQEVSQQTYERMQAERLAEAERLRARGQVAARQIRAGADREVVETVAKAQREAEILKGQGEAERSNIFADAYSKDPEFFDFYRSMQAYRQALENSGTTMVLSPNTEFFRYFNSDQNRIPGLASPSQSGSADVPGTAAPETSGTPRPEAQAAPEGEGSGPATSSSAEAAGSATGEAAGTPPASSPDAASASPGTAPSGGGNAGTADAATSGSAPAAGGSGEAASTGTGSAVAVQ